MISGEILKILKIISVSLLILFTIFLLTLKKGNRRAQSFLAVFLISRVVILINLLFWDYEVPLNYPDLAFICHPFLFLYAPMLYLYSQSIIYSDYRFNFKRWLHVLPFVLEILLVLVRFNLHSQEVKLEMIKNYSFYNSILTKSIWLWLQNIGYAIACLVLLWKYRRQIKEYYSSLERIKLSWLSYLLIVFFIWKAIFISGYLYGILPSGVYSNSFKIFIESGFLLYVGLIIYNGLKLPEVFNLAPENGKYKTSPLSEADKERYRKQMESCMHVEKPYLSASLTLTDLAKKSAVPSRYLSQILNESVRQNFYDYINYHRIEESKRLLADAAHRSKTILEILYAVGFNSKSVFNSAFKKQVGITPKEFKRMYQH
jgi:AraC-like DNA-binding protein